MAGSRMKNPRTKYTILDTIHIVFGISIIGFGIFALINAEKNSFFVAVLLMLVAVFQILNTVYEIQHLQRGKKSYEKVILNAVMAIIMIIIAGIMWVGLR